MKSTCKIENVSLDYQDNKPLITLKVDNKEFIKTDEFNNLKDKKLMLDLDLPKQKRSLNANACLWELCTKLSEKLGTSKEEMYLMQLKKYGQSLLIPVLPDTKPNGYFKYYEFREKGKINNKECDWYVVYKGSSEYTTKEMSILLEGTNNDCKELGIESIEEYKLNKYIEEW